MNPSAALRAPCLPAGERWPALGLGTWKMGESNSRRRREVEAVRHALDLGYRLIDTAEMYGEGGAEESVGEALVSAFRQGLVREDLRIVSKVYPHHATRQGVIAACERSLRRLGVDQLDLYLLHWRGGIALAETVVGFEALQQSGRIRHWGVSNFDVADLAELDRVQGGMACATNQVYYSLSTRGCEFDLMPAMAARRMPLMAYCPLDQGALAADPRLRRVAERHAIEASRLALAWTLRSGQVMAIPKAVSPAHLASNLAAAAIELSQDLLDALDREFPPPRRKQPLAMS